MDFDIVDYMYFVLEPLSVEVREGWYNGNLNTTHITFFSMIEQDSDYGDDINNSESFFIQIDIWSKKSKEARSLKKRLKETLKNNGFRFEESKDQFENDTALFHKAMRFNYTRKL